MRGHWILILAAALVGLVLFLAKLGQFEEATRFLIFTSAIVGVVFFVMGYALGHERGELVATRRAQKWLDELQQPGAPTSVPRGLVVTAMIAIAEFAALTTGITIVVITAAPYLPPY